MIPSRVRFGVVAFSVVLAFVTYLDRVCISVTAPLIMRDLSLTRMQMSFVFSAFTLAYALFEVPTALWADRAGARKVLTRIVVWWSVFTIATAAVFSYGSLLLIRFLFGAGEAGAWPSVSRTFSRWIPATERGKAQGIFFMGAHLAGGIAPVLVVALTHFLNWRHVFAIFGLLGFVWAAAWYFWFRDDPEKHNAVNEEELQFILSGRRLEASYAAGWLFWKRAALHQNTICLGLMYLANSYGFYFYITWLPTYLLKVRGFSAVHAGLLAGLPLTLSVVADLAGGVTTDRLSARFGLRIGRAGLGAVAYVVSGTSMILGAACASPVLAAVLIAISASACMFTLGAAWGTCIDIGGRHAGVVSAVMNTAGQLGAVLSPVVLAFAVDRLSSWAAALYLNGALYLVGAVCWCFIDPTRPLVRCQAKEATGIL